VRYTSEETAVEAHLGVTGEISPRRFTWHGSELAVEGMGRRWREGRERCFAVMAAGGRPFELRMDEDTLCWRVTPLFISHPIV